MATADVRLEVPATPEFLRVTRLTAAGVATRVGFSFDEVDDLRIAIDEVCFSLLGPRGREGRLIVQYTMLPDGVMVEGQAQFDDGIAHSPSLAPLSQQILDALTDECQVESGPEGPTFRLVKRHRVG